MAGGFLPLDENAFYAVVASGDVRVGSDASGFCGAQGYCGWHSEDFIQGTPVHYAFIGDPTQQCPQACGHANGFG